MTTMQIERLHPAAEWARIQSFDSIEVDCTTTVVLKILDGKCKMLPGEKAAILEIYDVVRTSKGHIFNDTTHKIISLARESETPFIMTKIHELRLVAEASIPKHTMKQYKSRLRDGLFG